MLSYALAIAVAISSLILFSTAFFMSKIHRKDDFLWSAVGLFYALILWFCARNITGTVLLGQAAATVLIISYCWQTIKLRRTIANPDLAVETNNFSVVRSINSLLKRRKSKLEPPTVPVAKAPAPKVTEQEIAIPETPASTPAPTSEAPTVIKEADEVKSVESDRLVSDTRSPDLKPIQERNNLEVIESQPLPNKLPETIAQPPSIPAPQPEKSLVQPSEQVDNLVTEAVEAVKPNPQTAKDTAKELKNQPKYCFSTKSRTNI